MKSIHWFAAALSLALLTLAGCSGGSRNQAKSGNTSTSAANPAESVAANLAKLGAEDRKLAEAQKFCAVETKNPLGSMGVPVKVMVKDQPVFLCCKGCRTKALADPAKTLARVEELKAKVKAGSPKK